MSATNMRLNILGDASGAKSALTDVEKAANIAAQKITGSFAHAGGVIKKAIGWVTVGAGLEMALEGASKLNNLQKIQSQLLENTAQSQKGLIDLQKYQMQGNKNSYEWKSKYLDQMATELSLQNGIRKNEIAQAQTTLIQNTDIMKFYRDGRKYIKGNGDLMAMSLTEAANIAEVTHGSIASSAMTLSRAMADPAKRMAMLYKMKIQLSKSEQADVKAAQAKNGLVAGQAKLMEVIDKHYHDIAKNAQSPIEMLKNQISLVWQSLGQGLLPILDALSNVLAAKDGPVQALIPVLQAMGETINAVSLSLGSSMGTIISSFIPFVQLMTTAIIPAMLNVIAPVMKAVAQIAKPLGVEFGRLVGTATKLGPLAQVFIDLSDAIVKGIQPGLNVLVNSFNQLNQSGKVNDLLMNMVNSMNELMPILPAMGEAMTAFLNALTPILVASLPAMVTIFGVFAQLMTSVVVPVMHLVTNLFKGFGSKFGGATKFLGALLAVWFTRKLFIAPIQLIGSMIDRLIGRFGALKSAASGFSLGESVKNFLMPGRKDRLAASANQLSGGYGGNGGALAGIADPNLRAIMQTNMILDRIGIGMNGLIGRTNMELAGISSILEYKMTPGGSRQGPMQGPTMALNSVEGEAAKASKWGRFGKIAGSIGKSGIGRSLAGGLGGIALTMGMGALGSIGDQKQHISGGASKALNGISMAAGFIGPWGMLISGAIQGLMLLYNKCKWFRDFVHNVWRGIKIDVKVLKTAFIDLWNGFQGAFHFAVNAVRGGWRNLISIVHGFVDVIKGIGNSIWHPIYNTFRSVMHMISTIWNATVGGFSMHIPFTHIGFSIPKMPKYHSGGIVPGPPGREVPAILQAGEAVTSVRDMRNMQRSSGGGMSVMPGAVSITIQGNADAKTVAQIDRAVNSALEQLLTKATIHR